MICIVDTKKIDENEVEEWWDDLTEECRLMQFGSYNAKVYQIY